MLITTLFQGLLAAYACAAAGHLDNACEHDGHY